MYFFQFLELNEEATTEFSSDTTEKSSTSETIISTSAGKVNYRINLPIDPELLDYYPVGKLIFYFFFANQFWSALATQFWWLSCSNFHSFYAFKVEFFWKASLDSITPPSPSVKIHGWESLFEVFRQNIAGCCQQTFENKKFVDNAQQCFAITSQANFPAHNLNFHWRWRRWDRIQTTF